MLDRLKNLDAHHRLLIALAAAAIVFALLPARHILPIRIIFTWDAFGAVILALAWIRIISANPGKVRGTAGIQDSSATVIFLSVIVAACASLFALFYLLGTVKDLSKGKMSEHVALAVSTVLCSWALVHTVFALRYANLFYLGGNESSDPRAGLDFPGEKAPDYMDFTYFSFVIGMTFQVSDVQITSRRIRRLALLHGIVSFAFNTVILALSINIISGLL